MAIFLTQEVFIKKKSSQISSKVISLKYGWFPNSFLVICQDMWLYTWRRRGFPTDLILLRWVEWFSYTILSQVIFYHELGDFLSLAKVRSFLNRYYTHIWVCHKKWTAPVDLPGQFHHKSIKTWKWRNTDFCNFSRPPTIYFVTSPEWACSNGNHNERPSLW